MADSSSNLLIHKALSLDYDKLCRAIEQALSLDPTAKQTEIQLQSLADIQVFQKRIASPLDPQSIKKPDPEQRKRLIASNVVNIALTSEAPASEAAPPTIRLGQDLVSVAIALSDDLHINEVDAAVLLFDARSRAAHRSDHDVVAAAKELYVLRRSRSILYLQEIIRAGLYHPHLPNSTPSPFLTHLFNERDSILTEHTPFINILQQLQHSLTNLASLSSTPLYQTRLRELVLLAETVFLIAYTIQLSAEQALLLYTVLQCADQQCRQISQATPVNLSATAAPTAHSRKLSLYATYIDSVRNLLLLSWFTALDRSRYHNLYDPRNAAAGVNALLKNLPFIQKTNNVPALSDASADPVTNLSPPMAAAELVSTVFRLAVASPNEEEATLSFVRLCAHAEALQFLSTHLVAWVQTHMGSLCTDADLYSDVLEDLALDIAEAPRLLEALIRYDTNEITNAVTESAMDAMRNPSSVHQQPPTSAAGQTAFASTFSFRDANSPRLSSGSWRKPPVPRPFASSSRALSSPNSNRRPSPKQSFDHEIRTVLSGHPNQAQGKDIGPILPPNLTALLATFIANAVAGAPSKLKNDSLGGGMRYWVGIGPSSSGLIPRIGDTVIDLWDATMRNANAPGGVGKSFREALTAFLLLLQNTCHADSPTHAAATLKYLRHGGHPVVSLQRASGALSFMNNSFTENTDTHELEIGPAESDALKGILDVISSAAESLRGHGGIMPILGDAGKDLAIRSAVLAAHPVPPELKHSLIRIVNRLEYRRAISALLEEVGNERSATLRRTMRNHEARIGSYHVAIEIMRLISTTAAWKEEFPSTAIQSIAEWFIIEEVLAFWSRRLYVSEEQRWTIIAAGAEALRLLLCREPNSDTSKRLLSRLLMPAPGTGDASFPMKALVWASGLYAQGDGNGAASSASSVAFRNSAGSVAAGRAALAMAASNGDGEVYRQMQQAVRSASKMLSVLLSVPPGRIGGVGTVIAPAYELLLTEPEAISYASSLVFSPDGYDAEIHRAGYEPGVCSAVLAMLARGAQCSPLIASILTKDPPGSVGSAVQFRASLSRLLASAKIPSLSPEEDIESGSDLIMRDPPIIYSILRILEACLGSDGGSFSGMFLLGFKMDGRGQVESVEYGVLGALLELIVGSPELPESFDKVRATAATFLDRLAADTVQVTSKAVLDHLKELTQNDPNVRGSGFADEMLFRICEDTLSHNEPAPDDLDWSSLTELLSACLRLSALQVRMFPAHEKNICKGAIVWGIRDTGSDGLALVPNESNMRRTILPSPILVLRVLGQAHHSGAEKLSVMDAFKAWYQMTGVRIESHSVGLGYAAHTMLTELILELLESLRHVNNEESMAKLLSADGGEIAASSVLHCTTKLAEAIQSSDEVVRKQFLDVKFPHMVTATCQAVISMSKSSARSPSSRTMLYSVLLLFYRLSRKLECSDLFAMALRVQSSEKTSSLAEELIEVATADALSSGYAATQSAALAAIAVIVRCHPTSAVRALGSHNRLRSIVQASLGDFRAKRTTMSVRSEKSLGRSAEPGKIVSLPVAKACLALAHSVVVSEHGTRVLSDSGCIEAIAFLLGYVEEHGFPELKKPQRGEFGNAGSDMSATDGRDLLLLSAACGAVAGTSSGAGGNIADDIVLVLDSNKQLFVGLLKRVELGNAEVLEAISSVAMIIAKLPQASTAVTSTMSMLKSLLAEAVTKIVPITSDDCQRGKSGSVLSTGVNLLQPRSSRENRRLLIEHPGGGNLFERDIMVARASCLQNCFSALRGSASRTLLLFRVSLALTDKKKRTWLSGDRESPDGLGNLSDVLRISAFMYHEIGRCTEEIRTLKRLDGREAAGGKPAEQMKELLEYVREEFDLQREQYNEEMFQKCIRKTCEQTRNLMDVCVSVLEGSLLVLREYVSTARDVVRGQGRLMQDDEAPLSGTREELHGSMSIDEASTLLEESKHELVTLCKEMEKVEEDQWMGSGSNLVKQVCRHIRGACSGVE